MYQRLSALALLSTASLPPAVQEPQETQETQKLETILVTPTRGAESQFEVPFTAEKVSAERIKRRSYRTTPQALRDIPGVMVQETAHGQGSPYLRGFTGYRNLFLIDGIRLNNSVFREGPNQYWNTVDPLTLDGLEVVLGPGSVLYGSDAIGGTVQALTRDPWVHGGEDGVGAELFYRAASAEESHTIRLETSVISGDTGVLAGVTSREFGDLQGGADIGTQPNTGYDELDGDLKVEHFLDESSRLTFAYQRVSQDNVPRTHRTLHAVSFEGTSVGSDRRRDLDQTRELAYLQLHLDDLSGFADSFQASLSWHDQEEQRVRVRGDGREDVQGFDVGTLGVQAQFEKKAEHGQWTWGIEAYHDSVDSFRRDLSDPTNAANEIQGPVADDATYATVGVFAQDKIALTERLDVTLGMRFEYAEVDAREVRDPLTDQQISVEDDWGALVGSARFTYDLDDPALRQSDTAAWKLFGGVSQGFRAPNLSDLTRFDSARSGEFEIPATGLDPERYLSFEVGVKAETERGSYRASTFYTDIENQIVRFPTGETNTEGEAEITKSNIGDGYVAGVELNASQRLDNEWTVFGQTAWLDGELSTFPTAAPVLVDEPLDRLMPWTTRAGLLWEAPAGDWWAEALVVHTDDADELSTRDAADSSRIPPGGTPGYTTGSLRAGWKPSNHLELYVGIENVTDEDYRVHGSGQNAAGRNFVFGMRATL